MKKIFVTGGSGYIGSVVVRQLLRDGYAVTLFDNLERGHLQNIRRLSDYSRSTPCSSVFDFVKGDLRNENEIKAAMDACRPDAVIHFAAYALVGESMTDPMLYFINNVKGGINLLEAMQLVGCQRLVFSSSCATYGIPSRLPIEEDMLQFPTNPYGQSKLMFEQMANWLQETRNFQPTFLRYFNAAGAVGEFGEDHEPETHIIPNVLRVALGQRNVVRVFGDDYPTPDGTCVRDYVHLADLSSAHILALEKSALGAYNLGTGHGVSVKTIIDTCRKITGRDIPVEICPRRLGDPPELFASGIKARRELEWTPKYSDIETIVSDAWNFHLNHPDGV